MKKFMVGYTVWNKVDMLLWLIQGIIENFSPTDTEIAFHFDACEDGCADAFEGLVHYWLVQKGGWTRAQIHALVSDKEVREVGGHNRLIDLFVTKPEIDMLIVAQDDQRFNKNVTAPLGALMDFVTEKGHRLGIVGGRDAYFAGYGGFVGSEWSESAVHQRVKHGEFQSRPYMNSGPVCYTRPVVEAVGKLDEEFRAYYVWDDYGARAVKAGFTNGVMGMDVTHAKFGRMKATQWCDWSGHDNARLHMKHPQL